MKTFRSDRKKCPRQRLAEKSKNKSKDNLFADILGKIQVSSLPICNLYVGLALRIQRYGAAFSSEYKVSKNMKFRSRHSSGISDVSMIS
jgi:hypothetical protein